ncbi:MAG TPA: VCBS repeat-containing protein [Candidatus Polarisedimenticolia bacterium]|nr:VCBS repeat-containing protein [Candidatus Polarisedimenticolia bacterium]
MTTARAVLRRFRFLVSIAGFLAAGPAIPAAPPTFATRHVINAFVNGLLPFDVRTEDVDRDGDLDIYTANYSGRVSWFENDGAHPPGPWVEHILTEFADGVEAAVAARVDGDADIDFFTAAFNRDEIAWYENFGDNQTWTLRSITFEVPLAVDVWAADLDRDGDQDAISASGFDSKITWYENMGANSWFSHLIGTSGESVEASDLDQDGDLDVLGGLAWFESDGGSPPSFTSHIVAGSPMIANAVAVLDVDRDGDPDVLSAGQDSDTIAWHENDGGLPPRFTTRIVTTSADFATGVYGADLDGDADVDLLSSSFFDDTVAWFENDGAIPPSFIRHTISTSADGARSVFAADVDEDGDMDVLSASQNNAQVVWHVNDANFADIDFDGLRDELDCAPANGTAFVIPREVSGVRFRSGTLLDWNSSVVGSGSGARYDVVQGTLPHLSAGTGSSEVCLANDASERSLTDGLIPALGTGFYYVVRATNDCGTGTFGSASSGVPRPIASCP